jgi:8-oxo-dGTP pyrophosphatase MutT (NUDIX family)
VAKEFVGLFEQMAQILSSRPVQTMPDIRAASRAAAVLVPVYLKNGEPMMLLTKRASHVRYHGGHVAFPGGVVDEGDPGAMAAALREAWEEIGLAPQDVTVLGPLDDSMTYAPPFVIHPFVGAIPFPYTFEINAREVEKIIEVPLGFFLSKTDAVDWKNGSLREEYYFPEFHYRGELIWGATAAIAANFIAVVSQVLGAS